ncbi:MAG: YtxH domain-containing protein [Gemmatimonadota bacterium]|nr:YtxH domain-containing protein [Gemmatimonadota bacterium]
MEDGDYRSEYSDALSFLAGLTLGALIGTGAALLLAPQSGERTRRQLARRAEDLTDDARDALDDVRDDARRLASRTRKDVRRRAEDVRRRADRTGDRLSEAVEKGRERIRR